MGYNVAYYYFDQNEEIADALISLGLGRPVGRTLANGDEATSVELEKGTGLRQPEVSIGMKQSKERDWINERDEGFKTIFH